MRVRHSLFVAAFAAVLCPALPAVAQAVTGDALRVKVRDDRVVLWNWLEDSYAVGQANRD